MAEPLSLQEPQARYNGAWGRIGDLSSWIHISACFQGPFPPGGGRGQEAPAPTPSRQGWDEGASHATDSHAVSYGASLAPSP